MNETELLFTHMLTCDRVTLYLDKGRKLSRVQSSFVAQSLKRRVAGEPVEYILGTCEFMGKEFCVNPHVLIPRPETEILVETALRFTRRKQQGDLIIWDIGTGSGNIAVALASFLPHARIVATDISESALYVARYNATMHECGDRIQFIHNDIKSVQGFIHDSCDLIVSNPPYIVSTDIDTLQPEVRCQPREALDGGRDGLSFYRAIAGCAARNLRADGVCIMEIGFGQGELVRDIFKEHGFFVCETVRDYNGIERVIVAKER